MGKLTTTDFKKYLKERGRMGYKLYIGAGRNLGWKNPGWVFPMKLVKKSHEILLGDQFMPMEIISKSEKKIGEGRHSWTVHKILPFHQQ